MTPHRITIDMKKSGYKQFVNIRQAENESHIIYISLTNGTEPIKLDNDMVATVYLEGISKQWESCDIVDNEIVFIAPILNVGDTNVQIQLSNDNGYSISPTFIIVAENILNVPHFELLEEEPDDWIDNADSYYTFNGIDYIPVKFSSDRNLLTNLEFKTDDHSAGSIVYKRSQAISVSQGRKIYCTTTSDMLSITLKFEYKIGDNLSGEITTKQINCKTQMPIVTPAITKRQYLENGYTDVVMSAVADSSCIDDNYKLTNTILEYDEKTYINCNTPYFEKGKFYAMVNDYGNVGNSYNALIQALQEARTYYNKAIKEVSMVDNCIVITYNDNTQYKSPDLKGDGIARLDKSTDGNVDTYTFVTDKGNTFSFNVTNADNTRIDDLYTQLGYKTPLTVFNNEVAYIKELINDLDTKKESIEEHNKSISQLKNSLSIINTQLSVLNNNKVEKDTYTTAIESLQSLVTKLQNSKVDTNTYNDEIANLTTAISELNDKQIDTNAIKESITELDTKKLNKEEFNQYKENVANTKENVSNKVSEITHPSLDYYPDTKAVWDYVNSKLETPLADIETLKSDKLDKTDFNSYKTSNDNAVNSKVDTTDFNAYKTATDKAVTDNTEAITQNIADIDELKIKTLPSINLTLPAGITTIPDIAFCANQSIISVTIPNSVKSIGHNAFYNCSSLASVTIPNSVKSIGHNVFQNCSSLASVTIGNGVTSIGNCVFRNCSSLANITIPDNVTSIGGGVFYDCTSLASVTIPDSVTSISNCVFQNCSSLANITIPNSVTRIDYSAFQNCTSLASVTIPDSVTSIGLSVFYNCSSLASVTIGNGVTSISNDAFRSCVKLIDVTLGDGFNANNLNLSVSTLYTADTIVSWLNALADRTGQEQYKLIIGAKNKEKLTTEQLAIATNKNWNIA